MEITKQEYLTALEVVNKYHEQISDTQKRVSKIGKTLTRDFIDKHRELISTRLYNAINQTLGDDSEFTYLEDIEMHKCMKYPNFGKKSWREFESLICKYNK